MEKVIIFGIIVISIVLLIKRITGLLKGDSDQGCACSSSESCSMPCHRQKEKELP